jgi:hypothetical protein
VTAGILAALGALLVAIVAATATYVFQERRYVKRRRERSLDGYLAPLQDACESFWYRVENLAFREGRQVMESQYHDATTLYVVARVLGLERMLALEGRYPDLWRSFPGLRPTLKRRALDSALNGACKAAGAEFHHYDRVRLGELAVERVRDTFRQRTFLEFEREARSEELEPARRALSAVGRNRQAAAGLLNRVREVALALSMETGMDSPLAGEREIAAPETSRTTPTGA